MSRTSPDCLVRLKRRRSTSAKCSSPVPRRVSRDHIEGAERSTGRRRRGDDGQRTEGHDDEREEVHRSETHQPAGHRGVLVELLVAPVLVVQPGPADRPIGGESDTPRQGARHDQPTPGSITRVVGDREPDRDGRGHHAPPRIEGGSVAHDLGSDVQEGDRRAVPTDEGEDRGIGADQAGDQDAEWHGDRVEQHDQRERLGTSTWGRGHDVIVAVRR